MAREKCFCCGDYITDTEEYSMLIRDVVFCGYACVLDAEKEIKEKKEKERQEKIKKLRENK